jgi:phosphoglycerate kinase
MTGKLSLLDLPVEGERVLVRVDYNVPIRDGKVADDRRIRASLPTLEQILARGGRPILVSHLGRPKGKVVPEMSLRPVATALGSLISARVRFVEDCIGEEAEAAAAALSPGEVLLCENLRFHPGEEKNDEEFARALSRLAPVFVNDAFGTAHRAHASTAGVCGFVRKAAAGLLMDREVQALSRLLDGAERPYIAVLGGAKVSDKIPLTKSLLTRVDGALIGGAMAYTFLKAKGLPVGASIIQEDQVELAGSLLEEASSRGVSVSLPSDHVVLASGSDDTASSRPTPGPGIEPADRGVDIGPRTVDAFRAALSTARTVLWNGPLGWFERPPFDRGTREIAEAIAASGSFSVVGGGDSAAAVSAFGLESGFSHISTGGGASLEFLSGLTLPGVASLSDRK